jgi:hypothetical protein
LLNFLEWVCHLFGSHNIRRLVFAVIYRGYPIYATTKKFVFVEKMEVEHFISLIIHKSDVFGLKCDIRLISIVILKLNVDNTTLD